MIEQLTKPSVGFSTLSQHLALRGAGVGEGTVRMSA